MPTDMLLDRLKDYGVSQNDISDLAGGTIEDATLREKRQALKILALRKAKKGDIFPLARLEWPELIITDKQELAEFKQFCTRKDHLDLRLDDFQVDEIRASFDRMHSQVLVSGGTKLGKGFTAGLIIDLWYILYPDSKIVLIGPDVEHVKRNLFAEAVTWMRKSTSYKDNSLSAECLTEKISDPKNEAHFIIIANPKTGEGLSGIHCHDDITEVMTDSGWKLFKDLEGTEQLLTMDPISKECHFEFPSELQAADGPGWMWECDEKFVNFCVTGNHRMLYYGTKGKTPAFKEADDFFSGSINAKYTPQSVNLQAVDSLFHRIPELSSKNKFFGSFLVSMDDWCRLSGWFISEGHIGFKNGIPASIRITQKKSENFEAIRRAMSPFGNFGEYHNPDGSVVFCISSVQLATHVLREMGHLAENKKCPRDIFSATTGQMRLFLDAHLAGDGYVMTGSGRSRKGIQFVHYTCSTKLASDLHAIRTLCGEYASVRTHFKAGYKSKIRGREITAGFDMNAVISGGKQHNTQWNQKKVRKVPYSGKVYCATVPTFGTLLTRRHGKILWSGNSKSPLFVFDESSGQPDSRYTDSLSQCASGLLLAIGNPRQPSGWFWRAFKGFEHGCKTVNSDAGPRRLISIGLIDCINVRANRVAGIVSPPGGITVLDVFIPAGEMIPLELREKTKLLIPGQGCKFVCETLKRSVTADEVEWRVYGRFPKDNKVFILFQQSWWEKSIERHKEIKDKIRPLALGIDVAGSENGDHCALAWGDTLGCLEVDLIRSPNLMMLKGEIYARASMRGVELRGGYVPVAIDSLAMGQMLADAMELDGCFVIRIGGSSGAERNKEQYWNRRAEMYGDLSGSLNPQTFQKKIWALPDVGELWEELHALEKIVAPDGRRYKLNSKRKLDALAKQRNQDNRDSIEEKIGRSPDRSDAVAYLFAAVMTLPDYFDESPSQFDPAKELKSYRDNGHGVIQCEFFLGKEIEMTKEDFEARFGKEPKIMGMGS